MDKKSEQLEHDIVVAGETAKELTHMFLRHHGWKHTSATPGSRWLWWKEIGNGVLLMTINEAFDTQQQLNTETYEDWTPAKLKP